MSARVLLVDDLEANRKVLASKLIQEYYQVVEAANGEEALRRAVSDAPDIILLDVMMPGMDGFEVCRRLKDDPDTAHIPVVFVSALDERIDRLRGLSLGADDFLTKPVDTAQLIARMRSLARMKVVVDELRGRQASGRRMGVIEGEETADNGLGAQLLVIDDSPRQLDLVQRALSPSHTVVTLETQHAGARPDVVLVSLAAKAFDGLRVTAHLRSNDATRQTPILVLCDPDETAKAHRALDLGAHDIIYRPLDEDELQSRVRTIVRRKRLIETMRASLDQSMELAVTDQLTGLNNRRYLMSQLGPLVQRAARGGDPVSVIIADVDHFKRINDNFGHDVGDEVLKEFAARLASNFRPIDISCRYGGEEFVVVMPNTRGDYACLVAERLRRHVSGAPFAIKAGTDALSVTVSLGVAVATGVGDTADKVLKRADEALYRAKQNGRNRVMAAAA
jgi:two-component system, cell cycle response regulator